MAHHIKARASVNNDFRERVEFSESVLLYCDKGAVTKVDLLQVGWPGGRDTREIETFTLNLRMHYAQGTIEF